MKYFYLALLFCLVSGLGTALSLDFTGRRGKQEAERTAQWLHKVYLDYIQEQTSIEPYLRPGLKQKLERMSRMLNCDPIIDAQDITEEMAQQLEVRPSDTDGYYYVRLGKTSQSQPILVQVQGKLILSIRPWKVSPQHLRPLQRPLAIKTSTPSEFITLFYAHYLHIYALSNQHLSEELEALHRAHCHPEALKQIEEMVRLEEEDALPGYDPLISGFDFDDSFASSFQIEQLEPLKYLISYHSAHGQTHHIKITLIHEGGRYLIYQIN